MCNKKTNLRLKKALTDDLGLPQGTQHNLPWYPPLCEGENINGEKFVAVTEKHLLDMEVEVPDYLRKQFLNYVNDGNSEEHEIGQRIISAMDKVSQT